MRPSPRVAEAGGCATPGGRIIHVGRGLAALHRAPLPPVMVDAGWLRDSAAGDPLGAVIADAVA